MQKDERNFNPRCWVDEQRLPGFESLLNSWLQVHKKFCDVIWPECSWEWDYKERSQIGFLSNAAVLIHGISLEEWGTSKKSGYGRNDLWLRLCASNDSHDYFIEAKHDSIDLESSESNSNEIISRVMNSSLEDAKRLKPKNGKAVAVSFFTLRFANQSTDTFDSKVAGLLKHVQVIQKAQLGLDALAAMYFTADTFINNRTERRKKDENWKGNEVGLIFMAKLV